MPQFGIFFFKRFISIRMVIELHVLQCEADLVYVIMRQELGFEMLHLFGKDGGLELLALAFDFDGNGPVFLQLQCNDVDFILLPAFLGFPI